MLPPWLEERRGKIAAALPPFQLPLVYRESNDDTTYRAAPGPAGAGSRRVA